MIRWFLLFCLVPACSSSSFPAAEESPAVDSGAPVEDTNPIATETAPPAPDAIDPIALDHAWTYEVQIFGTYPGCTAGTHTGKVLRGGKYQGRDAFEVQSFCSGFGTSWYSVAGDVVDLFDDPVGRALDRVVPDLDPSPHETAPIRGIPEGAIIARARHFEGVMCADETPLFEHQLESAARADTVVRRDAGRPDVAREVDPDLVDGTLRRTSLSELDQIQREPGEYFVHCRFQRIHHITFQG